MEQQLIATAYDAAKSYYTINAKTGAKTVIATAKDYEAADNMGATIYEETAAPTPTTRNRSAVPTLRGKISKADAQQLANKNRENSLALPDEIAALPVGQTVTGKCTHFGEKFSQRTGSVFPVAGVEINGKKFLILFSDQLEEGAEFKAVIADAAGVTRSGKTLELA